MQYRISDVARVLGITPNALHFFEKENIIQVEKDQSGYRNYSIADVFRLLSYEKYRSMGYPLKTVRNQFVHEVDNRSQVLQRVEKQKEDALSKAFYFTRLAHAIEEHLVDIRKIDQLLGQYEFAHSKDLLFLFDSEGGWISKHKSSQAMLHQWVDAMPAVRLAFLDFSASCAGQSQDNSSGVLGYMAEEAIAQELQLPGLPNIHKQPASLCLHTIIASDDGFLVDPASVFSDICEEAKRRGLIPNGHPWGTILLVEIRKDGGLRPYHSLWLPVKS